MGEQRHPAAEELEQEIAWARADLVASVHQLQEVLRDRLDFRTYVKTNPLLCVGGAFALGFWLGRRVG
ncbi:MAG: hypothetical protein HY698_21040 [Deltaproteobacteria bacterium]|nr:hypothetical protein [Deltaproteobacteria bacterium]